MGRRVREVRKTALILVVGLAAALVAGVVPGPGPTTATDGNTITTLDWGDDVGMYTSVALDGNGYPVVSYLTFGGALNVMHCNDVDCAGGNESITTPSTHTTNMPTSLVLDGSGNPVISYTDLSGWPIPTWSLVVMHCNDVNCAGSDESFTTPDPALSEGGYSSLVLKAGNPIISYSGGGDLKVMRCNDANCAGNDETINTPDTGGTADVGYYTSLALDKLGYPVVSYYDYTNGNLKVMLCNDFNCAGNDETINAPDTGGTDDVGMYTSLAWDADNPLVISYYDYTNGNLKVIHCGNGACSSGNTINTPDTGGTDDVGMYTSLALKAGNPIISYYDNTNKKLKVMHCNDVNCAGSNESITSPDTQNGVGEWTSLVMDGGGNPVVSYYDDTYGELKLLHCGDNCTSGNSINAPDPGGDVGWWTSLALDGSGRPVFSYHDEGYGHLRVRRCNDADCAFLSVPFLDTTGDVGEYTSLALDGSGSPVVSYYDSTNGNLKLLHCGNADCSSLNSIRSPDPDTTGDIGRYTSLALDSDGYPVVSYYDASNGNLKVMHCGDAICGGVSDSITSPDTVGGVGTWTSLALDGIGRPVVSYHDATFGVWNLKVMHCNDDDCAGNNETINSPDTGGLVGQCTSLALDSNGFPVVSYYYVTGGDLKVMHCNDINCAGGNETINSPDTGGVGGAVVGQYTSLALAGGGNPVVSYYDATNGDLKVMHCNDVNCAGNDESIVAPDTEGDVGRYTSLVLDSDGDPVVTYYDASHRALKLLHCGSANCTTGGAGGVGGIAELPDIAGGSPNETVVLDEGSGWSGGYAALAAGGLAAVALFIAVGGRYARRRWRAG